MSSSSTSSSPPRQPIFPRWPETNEESEYWEVPPDHFLAQQGKATSRYHYSGQYEYPYSETQDAQAGPSDLSHRRSSSASSSSGSSTTSSFSSSSSASSAVTITQSLQRDGATNTAHDADGQQGPEPLAELAHFFATGGSLMGPAAAVNNTLPVDMPDTSTLAGADFDIDVRSGFLPPEQPVDRLPDSLEESSWERMLQEARIVGLRINGGGVAVDDEERRRCRRWRRQLRELPIVTPSTKLQQNIRFARRGHVVLTFLAHFYIHSQPQPSSAASSSYGSWLSSLWRSNRNNNVEQMLDLQDAQDEANGKYAARLPASISVPLLLLSSQLDLPPVLTYADTVLWNWRYKDPSKGLVASNLEIVETFSGTPSEEHFFLTSLLIELRGVAALDLMRTSLDECFLGDALAKRRVARYLSALSEVVGDLQKLLHDVRNGCDPATFYWAIRPWFRGGDSSPHDVKGWVYPSSVSEDQRDDLVPRLFTGPSAGQSSLIHALDVFFDVDHAGTKHRVTRPPRKAVNSQGQVTADATALPEDATFMQRMQLYMPGQHRRFLTHLQSLTADVEDELAQQQPVDDATGDDNGLSASLPPTPLRHLAQTTRARSKGHLLPKAYDQALGSLKSLRDEHMKVATLYIITQARSKPPKEYAALNKEFVGHQTLVEEANEHDDKRRKRRSSQDDEKDEEEGGEGARGTGGTNLVQFLKQCRLNTTETLLGE